MRPLVVEGDVRAHWFVMTLSQAFESLRGFLEGLFEVVLRKTKHNNRGRQPTRKKQRLFSALRFAVMVVRRLKRKPPPPPRLMELTPHTQ